MLILALLVGTASLLFDGCKAPRPAVTRPTADWDKVAFALQLVRDEYGEQIEAGDSSGVTALATVLVACAPPGRSSAYRYVVPVRAGTTISYGGVGSHHEIPVTAMPAAATSHHARR